MDDLPVRRGVSETTSTEGGSSRCSKAQGQSMLQRTGKTSWAHRGRGENFRILIERGSPISHGTPRSPVLRIINIINPEHLLSLICWNYSFGYQLGLDFFFSQLAF